MDPSTERLIALMFRVEPPPSVLDVAELVRAGRRRQRTGRYALVVVAASATALILAGTAALVSPLGHERSATISPSTAPSVKPIPPSPRTAPTTSGDASCTIQNLAAPRGVAVEDARATDPTVRYVVADAASVVMWHDGVARLLPLPPGTPAGQVTANAVSSSGVVVGNAAPDPQHAFAWVYRDGHITKLPRLPGYSESAPRGVNAAGDIVGSVWSGLTDVPVIWPAGSNSVRRLPAPKSQYGADAYTIADNGMIGGTIGDGGTPYVWNATGHGHALPVPAGYRGGKVIGINGDWAVGWIGKPGTVSVFAARWNLRTGHVDIYDDHVDQGVSTSASGDFVGGVGIPEPGYLARNGLFKALPRPDGSTAIPVGISNDGKLIGGGVVRLGAPVQMVIWHC